MKNEFPRGELKWRRKGKWRAANKRVTRKIYRVTRTGMKGNLVNPAQPTNPNTNSFSFSKALVTTALMFKVGLSWGLWLHFFEPTANVSTHV